MILAGLSIAILLSVAEHSKQYSVDPYLVTSILLVESGGKIDAYNERTKDYGLMQINEYHIKRGLDKKRLLSDPDYSIKHGVRILAYFKRFRGAEPQTWYCRYNVGTGKMIKGRLKRCLRYKRKVDRVYRKLRKGLI